MIKNAKYIKDYKLRVIFDDGVSKKIDLYPFISESKQPQTRKFLDKKLFKKFYTDDWGLRWGDNEFDINPISIYKGQYDYEKVTKKMAL